MTGQSLRARLLRLVLRWLIRPQLARESSPPRARRLFRLGARLLFRDPPFTAYLPARLCADGQAVPALWARGAGRQGVLLYLHGGAYIMGSPRTHRALAATLAGLAGMDALLPRYRLAPEHPFPAAFEDARTAYAALLARGYPPERIALAGDSAGGGLALALLAEVLRKGWPAPAALVAFSPLTDMTFSGASFHENARRDAMLPPARANDMRRFYLGEGGDSRDPRASPLFAGWHRPPPVLLQASESEILRDDSLRMAARLRTAGGRVECEICGDLPHVWQIFQGRLPEADAALARAGDFLRRALPPARGTTPPQTV
ncbi:alpha/beta hydrolase [Alkalilacustris brevis]|uniref:alpha/beta hydrolase n=1 Tax=Alkalilacustris brevis TaxID=2026338 RepID=UPI001EE3B9AE|nr:alpha/beta hydrolase [Alkalilacustris brevis]